MRGLGLAAAALALAMGAPQAASADDHGKVMIPVQQIGEGLSVSGAWMRLNIAGRPAAGYFTLENAGAADRMIVAARAPQFERVEVHEHTMADGVMRMRPVEDGVVAPAGGVAVLQPGGYHLMFFGHDGALEPGAEAEVTLVFANGDEAAFTAEVAALGKRPSFLQSGLLGQDAEMEHDSQMDHGAHGDGQGHGQGHGHAHDHSGHQHSN